MGSNNLLNNDAETLTQTFVRDILLTEQVFGGIHL